MRWSSESGKKTCSQVDASTEAGFMHSYVVGHIGLDPSQPSILRNGDRGRRESSRQVPVRLFGLSVLSRRFFTIVQLAALRTAGFPYDLNSIKRYTHA